MNVLEDIKKWLPAESLDMRDFYVEATVTVEELETNLLYAYEHLKYYWLKDICVLDEDDRFVIRYILQNPQQSLVLVIRTSLKKEMTLNSVAPIWQNASAFESEAYEMFGVHFDYKAKRRFFSDSTQEFPLRKDFNGFSGENFKHFSEVKRDFVMNLNFPMNTNDISFAVELDHDVVAECDLDYGYHHIGLEKSLENLNSNEVLKRINLINYGSSLQWTLAWAMLMEEGNEILIPEKAMGIRMILSELGRIKEHLKVLMQLAYKTEYGSLFNTLLYWHNRTLDQLHSFTERKNVHDTIIIGGVRDNLPPGWMASCLDYLSHLEKHLMDEYKFFYNNSFWFDRLQVGHLGRQDAMKYAVGGPALRAAGVNHDLRKRRPFYFYKDVSFDVPLGVNGYVYDRFLVLIEEIFQSIKILTQVLDNIPAGRVVAKEVMDFANFKHNGEITDDVLYRRTVESTKKVAFKNSYISLESNNGLIDIWAQFDNENKTQRVKCMSTSSKLLHLFENNITGEKLEDLEIFWISLGIKMSEVER